MSSSVCQQINKLAYLFPPFCSSCFHAFLSFLHSVIFILPLALAISFPSSSSTLCFFLRSLHFIPCGEDL